MFSDKVEILEKLFIYEVSKSQLRQTNNTLEMYRVLAFIAASTGFLDNAINVL